MKVHIALGVEIIQSFWCENEKDEYEFVCLVMVSMRRCSWHVTQTGNSLLAMKFWGKFVSTRTRFTEVSNVLPAHRKSSRCLLHQVWRPYIHINVAVTRIFSMKTCKKTRVEKRETASFQSKVKNPKTRMKAKYQTSCRQNSY